MMEKKKRTTMTLFEKEGDLEFFIDSQGGKKLIIKNGDSEMLVSFEDENAPEEQENNQVEQFKDDQQDRKE